MKKLLFVLALLASGSIYAQNDKIFKHSGEVIEGKVSKIDEYTIVFKYEGEDAEQTVSKYAVERIIFGKSQRIQNITDKITIKSEDDWDKVILLEEKSYIAGLQKIDEIKGKTGLINFHTGNTGDRKAEQKLKMAAAALGCAFILLTADKNTVGASSNSMGGSQNIKKGIAYKY